MYEREEELIVWIIEELIGVEKGGKYEGCFLGFVCMGVGGGVVDVSIGESCCGE